MKLVVTETIHVKHYMLVAQASHCSAILFDALYIVNISAIFMCTVFHGYQIHGDCVGFTDSEDECEHGVEGGYLEAYKYC